MPARSTAHVALTAHRFEQRVRSRTRCSSLRSPLGSIDGFSKVREQNMRTNAERCAHYVERIRAELRSDDVDHSRPARGHARKVTACKDDERIEMGVRDDVESKAHVRSFFCLHSPQQGATFFFALRS